MSLTEPFWGLPIRETERERERESKVLFKKSFAASMRKREREITGVRK